MTTRAEQINILLAGLRGLDDAPLLRGTVYFYAAGTSNAKNVWTEKEKTNPFTSVTLDSFGAKQIYGDGIYKLVVKDADGNTLHTWDNVKIQATTFSLSTKIAVYTATSDDDVILADTDGGAFDVDLAAASTFERPLIIKNVGSSSNDATIDPNGAETIDGSASLAVADGVAVEIFTDGTTWYSAQSHSTTHERGGADEIDGDHLDIDWNPSNYTPATTPAEAGNADDLAAHLYGVDQTIFPSGTIMIFGQKDAPTGWTKKTDWQNQAILTISSDANGTALDSGGGVAAQSTHTHGIGSYAFPNHSHAVGTIAFPNHAHAAGTLAGPSHNHQVYDVTDNTEDDHYYDSGGSAIDCAMYGGPTAKNAGFIGLYMEEQQKFPAADMYSSNSGTASVTGSTASDAGTTCTGSTTSDAGAAITGTSAANTAPYYQEIILCSRD